MVFPAMVSLNILPYCWYLDSSASPFRSMLNGPFERTIRIRTKVKNATTAQRYGDILLYLAIKTSLFWLKLSYLLL